MPHCLAGAPLAPLRRLRLFGAAAPLPALAAAALGGRPELTETVKERAPGDSVFRVLKPCAAGELAEVQTKGTVTRPTCTRSGVAQDPRSNGWVCCNVSICVVLSAISIIPPGRHLRFLVCSAAWTQSKFGRRPHETVATDVVCTVKLT